MTARRVALVTGASRGIGRAAALALAERGFDVAITARTVHEGDATATTRNGTTVTVAGSLESTAAAVAERGTTPLAVPMDLLELASIDTALDRVLEQWGRIDALVNNAIYQGPGPMERVRSLSLEQARTILTGNFVHQLHLVQRVLPGMIERGSGAIVGVTSHTASNDPPAPAGEGGWGLGYAASKGAFHRIAGIVQVEHGGDGIRAYNVDPGHVITERQKATGAAKVYEEAGFRATPVEVPGAVIAWLAAGDDPTATELAGTTVLAARAFRRYLQPS